MSKQGTLLESPSCILRKEELISKENNKFVCLKEVVELLKKEISDTQPGVYHSDEEINRVKAVLSEARINPKDWRRHTNFCTTSYTRNLVYRDNKFTALILCWERGQSSPIHEHAGSSCWVKVLEGVLTETLYSFPKQEGGAPEVIRVASAGVGDVCYINDTFGLHKMSNLSTENVTVTLHVYSPPYQTSRLYEPDGATRIGVMSEDLLLIYRPPPIVSVRSFKNSLSLTQLVAALQHLSFSMIDEVEATSCESVGALVERTSLTEKDIEEFVQYDTKTFFESPLVVLGSCSLSIVCWGPGQTCTEPTQSWVWVIQGELRLQKLKPCGAVLRTETLRPDMGAHRDWSASRHCLGNFSETNCAISLHLCPSSNSMVTKADGTSDQKDISMKLLPTLPLGVFFTNFQSFSKLLNQEFEAASPNIDARITHLLQCACFNSEEWRHHANTLDSDFTRFLVSDNENYQIVLVCWDVLQHSNPHSHCGSRSWVKLLEGELTEFCFTAEPAASTTTTPEPTVATTSAFQHNLSVMRSGTIAEDSVTFVGPKTIHCYRNSSTSIAFSLHVYSPPYLKCYCYPKDSEPREIPTSFSKLL